MRHAPGRPFHPTFVSAPPVIAGIAAIPAITAIAAGLILGAGAARAAVLTAGPGGAYPTIQAALTAAQTSGAPDEIRVRAGSYAEHLTTGLLVSGNHLTLSGGWDATFTTRDLDPDSTTVNGGNTGRALRIGDLFETTVIVRGIGFTNGRVSGASGPQGAGILVVAGTTSVVRIESCNLIGNTIVSTDATFGAPGAGLSASLSGTAQLVLDQSFVASNSAELTPVTGAARGGGASIYVGGNATATVRRSEFSGNEVAGGGYHTGAGLYVYADTNAFARIEDSDFHNNFGGDSTIGSGLALLAIGDSTIDARRLVALANLDGTDDSWQVALRSYDTADLHFSDSLVVFGAAGLDASTSGSSTLRLTNLTVTGNAETGISLNASSPAVASLANSIAWNNSPETSISGNGVTQQSNLVGVNPLFNGASDFHLTAASPAVNAGTASPAGGLSRLDLDHAPRSVGLPDRGAFERKAIFGDGFETGDTLWWSSTV